jgi:glucosyl-dolichyl phosphate glucuronosyltransferase
MFISIVIATRNRSALLAETLRALASQRWPADRLEIIVADNGSTDDTRAVVRGVSAEHRGGCIRYLHVATPGKSHAVNAALRIAIGDLIAFTDDDVTPDPGWVANLAAAVRETGADFVAGRIRPIWEVPPPRWMSPSLHGVLAIPDNGARRIPITKNQIGRVMPIGANMAVRASVLAQLGGLRTDLGKLSGTLRTGEDHELYLRLLHAGCIGVYEPDAIVQHLVPASRLRRGYFRRWLYQNGRDVAAIERAYPPRVTSVLGVSRYLWRQLIADLAVSATVWHPRDGGARRFAAVVRVLWFAGYVRESWFGGTSPAAPELAPAESR